MRAVQIFSISLLITIGMSNVSCVGTEVGNPQDADTSEVSMGFAAVERTAPQALTLANGIEFIEAWMVIEEIEFKDGTDCDQEVPSNFEGIHVVEFISGQQIPPYDMSSLPPRDYCRMEINLEGFEHADLPAGAPEELNELAIWIRGRHADGTPFVLSSESSETLLLHGPFELFAGRQALFIVFALSQWLSLEQLDDAKGDGEILIDDEHNPTLLDEFLDNLEKTVFLVRDENEDGQLQEVELAAPLATGGLEPE